MKKILLLILFFIVVIVTASFVYLFVGFGSPSESITWGVNYSPKHAKAMGLDWKATYSALLDDLGARNLKVAVHWDDVHIKKDEFDFQNTDWLMEQAEMRGAKVLLVIGMKTPRWPECHVPDWAENLSKEEQQGAILSMLGEVVDRYKDNLALWGWQVENEPFFLYGECPWKDDDFLKEEVKLVRSLDSEHPVVVSDTGEFSLWMKAASVADMVGVTMYRKVWFSQFNMYVSYPFPSVYYSRRADLIEALFGKKVIGVEVQAEPWGPGLLYNVSVEEQKKTMTLERFRKNIEFAKNTGLDTLYLWGGEWWYWMREVEGDESIWNEAKKLF
ncbi:MAG TPA: hypothetical protein ENI04_00125 [Candidatus Wildermuthbacteria bacterium]|nr:hypothetical protein [Candidatus Wildermuthbacteria bacterium]